MRQNHSLATNLAARTREVIKDATATIWRTPVEVAIGLALAACACIAIHDNGSGAWRVFGRIVATSIPLLVAIFGVSVLHAFGIISTRARHGLTIGYLVAGAIYGNMIFHPHYEAELWRWVLIASASSVGFALLPMAIVRQKGAVRDMLWTFNVRMAMHITASLGFLFALATGLVIGAISLDELLGFNLPSRSPGYIYALIMLGAGPWVIASGLPVLLSERGVITPAGRKLLAIVCTYLFTPLMMLYLVILYAYQGRVILDGMASAPKNLMSPLVIAASMMMLAGLMFTEQLKRGVETSTSLFVKLSERLPLFFLPLMPMTAWAVWVRIEQHGWTEFRYLRLVLVACLSFIFIASVVRWRMKRPQPLGTILAAFGVAAILSSFGPWSALEVSKRSQIARLTAELEALGLMHVSPHATGPSRVLRVLDPTSEKDLELTEEAVAKLDYLAQHFGPSAFEGLVDPETYARIDESNGKRSVRAWDVREALGWNHLPVATAWQFTQLRMSGDEPTPIPGPGKLYDLEIYRYNTTWKAPGEAHITITQQGDVLEVQMPGGQPPITASLSPHRARLEAAHDAAPRREVSLKASMSERVLNLEDARGEVIGVIVLDEVSLHRHDQPERFEWNHVRGYLLLLE